jgi:PPK2 family polyphosphate:nucleotide phosphotransferase
VNQVTKKDATMGFSANCLVRPDSTVDLSSIDPRSTWVVADKRDGKARMATNLDRLWDLQYRLYAEDRRSLLIVLQGMDTAGKDGTIRHVMGGLNPQGCRVQSFKAPSVTELDHDFLWRIHRVVPSRGEIGIFNRSHYEDVLIVRVHDLAPKSVWSKRYEQINRFEKNLAESGTTLLKFFLHISKEEQRERLQERLDDPSKHWKFNPGDLKERKRWNDYVQAYEDVLRYCSTSWAPWFVIPSDRKWFRNLAVSEIVAEALEAMDPKIPPADFDPAGLVVE